MKLIYTGRTPSDAHLFAALLAERGIAREIRGEPMWQSHEPRLSPKIPTTTVWVEDADADAAEALANEHRAYPPAEDLLAWTCPRCGEGNPSRFDECWNCSSARIADVNASIAGTTEVASPGATGTAPAAAGEAPPSTDSEAAGPDFGRLQHTNSEVTRSEDTEIVSPEEAASLPAACDAGGDRPPWRNVPLSFPWGSLLFTVVCTLVWYGLSSESAPESDAAMKKWGWRSAHDVWSGAYWSLLAAAFVHADWPHLRDNMLWFWVFGLRIEQILGTWRWLAFLIVSAFVSAAIDQAWLGEHSYGASGVTNAAFGLFLVASLRSRLMPFWISIPICIYFFATGTWLDLIDLLKDATGREILDPVANVCHLAGFTCGVLFGMAWIERWKPAVWWTALGATAVAAVIPLVWAPWSFEWCLGRAEAAWHARRAEQATAWCDRAIEKRPEEARAYVLRAEIRFAQNQFDDALADANRAVQLDDAVRRARTRDSAGGHGPVPAGDELEAPTPAEAEPDSSKVTGSSYLIRGEILFHLRRYDEAEHDLTEAIRIQHDAVSARVLRGTLRWERSQFPGALNDLTVAADSASSDPLVRLIRGAILRDHQEPLAGNADLELAIQVLHDADDPALKEPTDPAKLAQLSWAHQALGEYEEADKFATKALARASQDGEILSRRAMIRLRLDRPEDALADAKAAVGINRQDIVGWTAQGMSLDRLDRADEAAAAFTRAIEINPRYVPALIGRGAHLRRKGEPKQSLHDLNRALELNPRSVEGYLERSLTHRALGTDADADADRRVAEALDPNSVEPDSEGSK